MVFTTKHHDGFCMFDSYYTDYKITRTPYGKDIVAQLADACHINGMGLGLYYSPPDMHHPAYRDTSKPATTNYRGEPTRPEWPLLLDYISLQLHELLTRYGKVMEIWFDSVDWRTRPFYDGQRFIDEVHRLQPDTLINDRLGIPCDFVTAEQYVPKAIPEKGVNYSPQDKAAIDKLPLAPTRPQDFQPWEACMTINDTWAYRPKDHNFKSTDKLIRTLIEVISRGGNFLLDIGPKPDGLIQQEFVDRLQQVGAWALANSAAIYGSTYGPVQGQPAYRTTSRGNSTYVFVMDDAAQEIIMPHGKPVQHVRLISDNRPVKFHSSVAGTRIPIDASLRDAGIPVLEIR
jgi:alpha-L-fucosidase